MAGSPPVAASAVVFYYCGNGTDTHVAFLHTAILADGHRRGIRTNYAGIATSLVVHTGYRVRATPVPRLA